MSGRSWGGKGREEGEKGGLVEDIGGELIRGERRGKRWSGGGRR